MQKLVIKIVQELRCLNLIPPTPAPNFTSISESLVALWKVHKYANSITSTQDTEPSSYLEWCSYSFADATYNRRLKIPPDYQQNKVNILP